jgi:hypothetical protein
MSSIANTLNGIEDPSRIELEFKMSSHIKSMPTEMQPRFKALKIMQDELLELEDEQTSKIHESEIMYEKIYEEIYTQRREVMMNKMPQDTFKDLIEQFDQHIKKYEHDLKHMDEVTPCNVNDTIISKKNQSVANFWQRAMLNHPNLSQYISDKDRVILQSLVDIQVTLHEDYGFGFDIKFTFEDKNPYFLEDVLVKKFVMSRQNVIEKTEQTKINWKEGFDPTRKKVKKKRKGKKVTVEAACDSFFTFFD